MAAAFDLTRNPFHLLSVSARATREEIAEAQEEALAEGLIDEEALTRAQQVILTPRTRTEAELSWLVGLSPSRASEILSMLTRSDLGSAEQTLTVLEGIDRVNLAADLCVRAAGDTKFVNVLLEAYGELDESEVAANLASLRSISGFPVPDPDQIRDGLGNLMAAHAKAAAACITAAASPGKEFAEIVESALGLAAGTVDRVLSLIGREYDAWSEPRLRAVKERIEESIAACRDGGGAVPVAALSQFLAEWDETSQPIQLLDEAKGHEEPRSKEIYGIVRDFCLWLSREKRHYEDALAICRALLDTFPELPAVAAQLSRDVDALEVLAADARSVDLLAPLNAAQEAALERVSAFSRALLQSGFGPHCQGLAKTLYDAFAAAAEATLGTVHEDLPWQLVRAVAIELNNRHHLGEAARIILDGLMSHQATPPSQAILERLRGDQRAVHRNFAWGDLRNAGNDVSRALFLVSDLLSDADEEERATLLQIQRTLERRRSGKVWRVIFASVATAVIIGVAVFDNSKRLTSQPEASAPVTTPHPTQPSTPALQTSDFAEDMPPPGDDRLLSRNEIRYCLFQSERLEVVQSSLSGNAEIDRYNALVDDWNARCSSFRYYPGILQTIEAEVSARQAQLRQDAQTILAEWRTPSSPSTPEILIDINNVAGAARVQAQLARLGFYAGATDGIWGPMSRSALQSFKTGHDLLPNDDIWNLETQRILMGQ